MSIPGPFIEASVNASKVVQDVAPDDKTTEALVSSAALRPVAPAPTVNEKANKDTPTPLHKPEERPQPEPRKQEPEPKPEVAPPVNLNIQRIIVQREKLTIMVAGGAGSGKSTFLRTLLRQANIERNQDGHVPQCLFDQMPFPRHFELILGAESHHASY